jgi:hypothetical protein
MISASRADAVRPLEDSQMQRRGRLAATPHHFTDQRLEGWRGQTPRGFADAKKGGLAATPRHFTDQRPSKHDLCALVIQVDILEFLFCISLPSNPTLIISCFS